LRGAIRHGGTQGFSIIIGIIAAVFIGLVGAGLIAGMGHVLIEPNPLLITFPVAVSAAIVALGVTLVSPSPSTLGSLLLNP
jgi:flagellar motor component MotA